MAKSIMDYIFRWQASKFLDNEAQQEVGTVQRQETAEDAHQKKVISMGGHVPRGGAPVASIGSVTSLYQQDAPPCTDCGSIMIRFVPSSVISANHEHPLTAPQFMHL